MDDIVGDKTPVNVPRLAQNKLGNISTADKSDISALSGVMDYEPEELIITALPQRFSQRLRGACQTRSNAGV